METLYVVIIVNSRLTIDLSDSYVESEFYSIPNKAHNNYNVGALISAFALLRWIIVYGPNLPCGKFMVVSQARPSFLCNTSSAACETKFMAVLPFNNLIIDNIMCHLKALGDSSFHAGES